VGHRAWLCLASIVSIGACSFTAGKLPSDADVVVNDDMMIVDAIPDAAPCVAASTTCVGDTLRTCSGAGAMVVERACGWGCDATGAAARCAEIVPAANAVTTADLVPDPALADVTLGDNILIDTANGRIGTLANVNMVRPNGVGLMNGINFAVVNNIGVFRVKSLRITAGMSAAVGFQSTLALAIVADGPIVIEGFINVRGNCMTNIAGAGGSNGGTAEGAGDGMGGGSGGAADDGGGGGGGHGGDGGRGATGMMDVFRLGGVPFGDEVITVLVGGSGGGSGGGGGAFGGSGGGAIQLVSNTSITITSGGINAGGCGGEAKGGGPDGGGGGGAGGTILLEAPAVTIAANAGLAVNGGAGAAGDPNPVYIAPPGSLSRVAAVGGPDTGPGGRGGDGAAGANTNGSDGSFVDTKPGGGGGGGMGRIRINTHKDAGLTIDASAILSQDFGEKTTSRGAATTQ
jgi:hypothetical protein